VCPESDIVSAGGPAAAGALCYARAVRFVLAVMILLTAAGCRQTGSAPTPIALGDAVFPPVAHVEISGRLVATITGEPLAGATLDLGGVTSLSDQSGAFMWSFDPRGRSNRLTVSGPAIITRTLTVNTTASREIALDAISLTTGFDLDYYRRLVRNTSDAPGTLRPIRRWTRPPLVYLKTVDEAGHPIDEFTLATTEAGLLDEPEAWTGGQFGLAGVVRGTSTREGQSGWVTVKWPNPATAGNNCGRAQVGLEGGWIELNYLNGNCACGGSRVGAGIVRHELGHALGFFHTAEPSDLLRNSLDVQTLCQGRASARERFHAAIAYSRPVGNTDPDNDPTTSIQRDMSDPIVIVD
jgi:hypothetical protein